MKGSPSRSPPPTLEAGCSDLRLRFLDIFSRLLVGLLGFRIAISVGLESLDRLAQAVAARHLGLEVVEGNPQVVRPDG